MGLSVGEQNKALDAWIGRTTYTANTAVWAKLHTGAPGSAGTSNAASSTTRKQVSWAAAASQAVASNAALTWSGSDLTASETITDLSFWTASSGGTYLGNMTLNASAAVTSGETLDFASGTVIMSLTGTKMAVGECNKALDAWAGTTTYTANAAFCLKLHTGDPGSAGTSNAATDTTRKAVTFGSAASAGSVSSTASLSWTGLAGPTAPTTETIAWFSFWTATSAGTFLGRDDLATSRAISSGDGLDVASGAVTLSMT